MQLDIKNLQLYRPLGWEYLKIISGMGYGIKNYNNEIKYMARNEICVMIKRHQILGLEEYNI